MPAPPSSRSWPLALLTVVVVGVLAAPIAYAAVHRFSSSGSATASAGPDPTTPPTPTPTGSPTGSSTPKPTSSPSPSPSVRCWNGSPAQRVVDCSRPQGRAGLRWVFPSMKTQRCADRTPSGIAGLQLRVICRVKDDAGNVVQVGYAAWSTVGQAEDYFAGQGLSRTTTPGSAGGLATIRYGGVVGRAQKDASLYAKVPFSLSVTVPAGTTDTVFLAQVAAARPAGQVRGAPVQTVQ